MSDTKSAGRPRLYATEAEKLSAFRSRQESTGYLRREVLLSPEAAATVKGLAAEHNVSALDVTSALFELGLSQYQARPALGVPTPMPSVVPTGSLQAVALPNTAFAAGSGNGGSRVGTESSAYATSLDRSIPDLNPISSFFNRRKDANHVK